MGDYITYDQVVLKYAAIKTAYERPTDCDTGLILPAERELNGLLGSSYGSPLPDCGTVRDLMIDLCYKRYLNRFDAKAAWEFSKSLMARIKRLARGEEQLYLDDGTLQQPIQDGLQIWSETEDYAPTFSMLDSDSAFSEVDPDRLEAERNERG